ncbi:MAG TPA: hypothetical protein VFQ91_25725, partial [Bryobacteraceae bacterium]|nr:hypothetical protein [Bryobacteraceae bacterium]
PIIPQIEAYANKHGISLERGWKVQLAKRVKLALLKGSTDPIEKDTDRLEAWKSIFTKIQSSGV